MLKKIKKVPVALAIVIMAACMLAGIALGNQKALSRAANSAKAVFGEVEKLSAQRAEKAANLLVLCNRSIEGSDEAKALAAAIGAAKDARTPSHVAEANSKLASAADVAAQQVVSAATEEDRRLAVGVLDDLVSLGKQLDRQAKAYNEAVAAAEDVYKSLPMRFLIGGMPEVYQ